MPWERRPGQKQDSHQDSHVPGSAAGLLHKQAAPWSSHQGHSSPQSGQDVAQAVAQDPALDRPEVGCPGATPRDPLRHEGQGVGLDHRKGGYEQKGRDERPESAAEIQPGPGPTFHGNPGPQGLAQRGGVQNSEGRRCSATQRQTEDRSPDAPEAGSAKHKGQGADQSNTGAGQSRNG